MDTTTHGSNSIKKRKERLVFLKQDLGPFISLYPRFLPLIIIIIIIIIIVVLMLLFFL